MNPYCMSMFFMNVYFPIGSLSGESQESLFLVRITSHSSPPLLLPQVLFQRVIPHECLEYIREPKDADNAQSVRACIQHFNRVSLVVIATILDSLDCEGRGLTIGRWIDIALQCRAIKNFSSLKAIVSGLQLSSVYRLKKSWEAVTR